MKRLTLLFLLQIAIVMAQQNIPGSALSVDTIPLAAGNTLQGLAGTASAVTYTIFGVNTNTGGNASYGVLAQGVLGTSNSVLYTVPNGVMAFVSLASLANTTSSAVTGVTLAVNGSSATAAFQVLPGITLPANGVATLNRQAWQVHDVNGNTLQTGTQAFDTVGAAVTTPLALGAPGTSSIAARRDHQHQSPGACASIVAQSAAIVNVEAQVVACSVPATLMQAGTTFRITAAGTITTAGSPGNDVFKVRIGTTTLTGNIAGTVTAAAVASITTQPFYLDFLVTVRTAGASGTVVGQGIVSSTHVTTGAFTALNVVGITTTSVALDTTAVKIVELTVVTGASDSSVLIQNASIEIVKM
jgi:hypothetical protein